MSVPKTAPPTRMVTRENRRTYDVHDHWPGAEIRPLRRQANANPQSQAFDFNRRSRQPPENTPYRHKGHNHGRERNADHHRPQSEANRMHRAALVRKISPDARLSKTAMIGDRPNRRPTETNPARSNSSRPREAENLGEAELGPTIQRHGAGPTASLGVTHPLIAGPGR